MRIAATLFAAVASLTAMPVAAGDGVGEAMAVIDAASVSGQVDERALAVGSSVFIGDVVATDAIGEAQLLFQDGTRMVVGPNSSLVIDAFLFRGGAAENKFSVRALGGAFRFISGESGDKGYTIRTPSATIGVRGTAFDFTVTPDGQTNLVLLKGAATLCAEDGQCTTVEKPCELVRTTPGKQVEAVENDAIRAHQNRKNFPYLTSQWSLLDAFRLNGQECASDAAETDVGLEGAVAAAPAAEPAPAPEPEAAPPPDPAPAPAPEPAPDVARGNNGIGNGGEVSQGEDSGVGNDPSNPGQGQGAGNGGGNGATGGGESAAASDGSGTGTGGGNGNGGGNGGGRGNGNGGGNGNGNGGGGGNGDGNGSR